MDRDSPDTKNSDIRYEIINGNYERKFSIDEYTGVISVTEPLNLNFVRQRGKENGRKRKRNLRKSRSRRERQQEEVIIGGDDDGDGEEPREPEYGKKGD